MAYGLNLYKNQRVVEVAVSAIYTSDQTIEFLLTAMRDAIAALSFSRKAIRQNGEPKVVIINKSGADTAVRGTISAYKAEDGTTSVRQSSILII